MLKLFKNQKGFSLVELIMVISVSIILMAVLIPSMLHWVERSRAAKDNLAMDEMCNAVMLALSADQNIYDEVLYYATFGNISCYVDKNDQSLLIDKVVTREEKGGHKEQFLYGDDNRMLDEIVWYAAGNMRGVTITFQPEMRNRQQEFVIANAVINKYIQDITEDGMNTSLPINGRDSIADGVQYVNDAPDYSLHGTLGEMKSGNGATATLYHRLKTTFGESINITSATYRNSEYTVFIRLGSLGYNDNEAQRAVVVYGQWNGTNLYAYDMQPAQGED